MRRISSVISILVIALIATVVLGRGVAAQDATPVAAPAHPLIGTWLVDTEADNPENPPSVVIFHADGSVIEIEASGVPGGGTWTPTGAQTADLTLWFLEADDEEFFGYFIARISVEVAADGTTFTAQYTGEFVGADGEGTGEYGPGTATGERLSVEPMGTPIGTFEELFELFEEEEGTPSP